MFFRHMHICIHAPVYAYMSRGQTHLESNVPYTTILKILSWSLSKYHQPQL